jgi:hypothetical protein
MHPECWGFSAASYSSLTKIPPALIPLKCNQCTSYLAGIEDRLAAVERQLAQQAAAPANTMTPELVKEVVAQVLKEVLPQVLKEAREASEEAVEAAGKKNSLVVIGLTEDIEPSVFVDEACAAMNIDRSDVVDTFRDGQSQADRPRIVKVKFSKQPSRHKFLIGLRSKREDLPGAANAWVRPDLTYRQRQADRILREELKRRRDGGEEVKISRGKIVPK